MSIPKAIKPLVRPIKSYLLKRWHIPYSPVDGIPGILANYLEKKQPITFIDIGAHEGDFSKAIAGFCGVNHGVVIEANPFRVKELKKYFKPPMWNVYDCAIVEKPGHIEFYVQESFDATSSVLPIKRECESIHTLPLGKTVTYQVSGYTLDHVIADAEIDYIDLIKIDVQGAEHMVLKGGQKTLEKTKMIWTETSFKKLYEGSSTFSDIYSLLDDAGFSLREISPGYRAGNGELVQCDVLFIKR